ncbi:MAG: hypothetical protein KIC94_12230 [Clostridiales bacterium]|nr:hypothetical protein [Clostridiales bacterium]
MGKYKLECTDYLIPDLNEDRLLKKLKGVSKGTPDYKKISKKLNNLQLENRGVNFDVNGKVYVNNLTFAKYCLSRLKIIKVQDTIYIYNRKYHHYESIALDDLGSILMSIMEELKEEYYRIFNESELFSIILRKVDAYKRLELTSGAIVMKNGVFYIKKQQFRPKFSMKIINLSSVSYDYDPKATCPKFNDFLNDIFDYNQQLIRLIQQIFGYTFCYGEVRIHKLFYWLGCGRNGKGVLTKILQLLHGEENVSSLFLDDLTARFNASALVGKVLNISPEGKQSKVLDTAMIKSLTAGDSVMVERKYHDPYSTNLSTKFIVCSNYPLLTDDDSNGFLSRLVPIPFNKVYHERPSDGKLKEGTQYQDPYLFDKLKEELPGIFNWCMEGLNDLQNNNWTLATCNEVDELRLRYALQSKPVRLFFRSCISNTNGELDIKSSEVHSAFKMWARVNNIPTFGYEKSAEFHEEFRKVLDLENLKSATKLKKGYEYYYGIQLREDYRNSIIY